MLLFILCFICKKIMQMIRGIEVQIVLGISQIFEGREEPIR